MLRTFSIHRIRPAEELDGLWEFQPVEEEEGIPDRYGWKLPVPGVWEMHPEFLNYRGRGAYRRIVLVDRAGPQLLEFYGVSHTADVYWDGARLGHHYDGHTRFQVRIPFADEGAHELVVVVDNRFTDASTLNIPNDYYTYGGITRPVSLSPVPACHLEAIRFTPEFEGGCWWGSIWVGVRFAGDALPAPVVSARLAGSILTLLPESIRENDGLSWYTARAPFPDVYSWSPDHPELYLLTAELRPGDGEEPSDDLIERVGFRTIEVDREGIRINGDLVVLRGFNRHEDYPGVGCALPFPLMVQDLEILRDLGANAVRTAHYPNDERFLDLCDEMGFLVWEEHHARGFDLAQMTRPGFFEQISASTREMVSQHQTHAAIAIWGVFNECASDREEARPLYREQIGIIRDLDPSRPVTYATHHRDRDRLLDLVDVVSYNLYPGWYTEEEPEELFRQARAWADAAGGHGKPVIISETGADGFYGFREPKAGHGSEERQTEVMAADVRAALHAPLAGLFLWQFADCRVSEEGEWFFRRPMGQNAKGVVDRYRRPKLAYAAIRDLYREASRERAEDNWSGP